MDDRKSRARPDDAGYYDSAHAGANADENFGTFEAGDVRAYQDEWRRDYLAHHGRNPQDYARYEPAYRYGHGLAHDARYRGQSWDTIEPSARRDWERQHPGSAWRQFKDAVRHAWDRARGAV